MRGAHCGIGMTFESHPPIIVIGTHRSGTSLLAGALGHHPEVAYWEEPRHVWSWGNNYQRDDRLEARHARPAVKAHIRRRFARFLHATNRSRLAEKTPSNCLRLPFVREVFPEALFVHIYRDGRAVVSSTDVVTSTRTPEARFYGPRLLGTPVWEWPALLPRAWRTLGRRLLDGKMTYWGPRPPSWRRWLKEDEPLVVLAKQWRHTLEPVLEFRAEIPASQWLDVRYEDLVSQPAVHAERLESFAGLRSSPELEAHLVGACHRGRIDAWKSLFEAAELAAMRPVLEPPLERLGYVWENP